MERLLKKVLVLCYIFAILPAFSYADTPPSDTQNENIDAETNISIVENSIKINEEEFNKVVEQIAKRYPNFDWATFDSLDSDAQRIVLKNYLARLAFDEIKENYVKDIRARAKDGISTEKRDKETYYFNKSDTKYRTHYVTEQDLVKKAKVSNKCEGCSWVYFKQKDVKLLDELIKQETAKAPADTYCEKYCAVFDQEQEDIDQQFLAKRRNYLEEYEKIQKQYLSEMRKNGVPRKEIKEERKKIASEIRKIEEEYANWERITKGNKRWHILPYNTTCEMVTVACYNVERYPENYERFELRTSDRSDTGIIRIRYEYDDLANNTHTEADAWRSCNCTQDVNDVKTYVSCKCHIHFFDEIQDFTEARTWENQNRIDIKNGINQDQNENGGWNHEWASNTLPGGHVVGRTLDIKGMLEKTLTKSITE